MSTLTKDRERAVLEFIRDYKALMAAHGEADLVPYILEEEVAVPVRRLGYERLSKLLLALQSPQKD